MASNVIPFPRRNSNDDDSPPSPAAPALIAQLLAPLPDTEVPAGSMEFLQQLRKDKRVPWHKAQLRVEALEHLVKAHLKMLTYAAEYDRESEADYSALYHEHVDIYMGALHDLMMTPAPDGQAYRWKAERSHTRGRHTDWNEVIDADLARLQRRAA